MKYSEERFEAWLRTEPGRKAARKANWDAKFLPTSRLIGAVLLWATLMALGFGLAVLTLMSE